MECRARGFGHKKRVSDAKLLSFSNQIRVKIEVVSSPV